MDQVSRPVQVLLAVTVVFALVWFVALRPKSSDDATTASAPTTQEAPAAPGTEGLTNAVEEARSAVSEANGSDAGAGAAAPQSAARSGGASARQPAPSGGANGPGAHTANAQVGAVRGALRAHKAVALAFVDPFTADARAVDREMRQVSRFGGRAYLASVPLVDLADFGFITSEIEVAVAPTIVIVTPGHKASTIVGFADRVEIEQRIADALAS